MGFSVYGNVTKTVKTLVDNSEKGMTAGELKQLLKVEVKEPLLRLFRRKQLYREKMSLVYVYFTEETFERRKQMLFRRVQEAESVDGLENLRGELLAHELKAAVIIFFSLLDEKQRRLYAGLESLKQGYGGDSRIAELLGLDSHTVAKGRQEVLNQDFEIERVRREGGGRTPVKKTPEVIARIEELMKYETAGDPITGLKWTRKTTEKIAEELESIGIMVSANTAGKLQKKLGFSLRVNRKKNRTWEQKQITQGSAATQ